MPPHNMYHNLSRAEMPASGKILTLNGTDAIIGWGTTVPADGTEGYAVGATFYHTDGSGATTAVYTNVGSASSSDFDAQVSPTQGSAIADVAADAEESHSITDAAADLSAANEAELEGFFDALGANVNANSNKINTIIAALETAGIIAS